MILQLQTHRTLFHKLMKRTIFLGTVIALTLSSCFSSPSTPPQADLQEPESIGQPAPPQQSDSQPVVTAPGQPIEEPSAVEPVQPVVVKPDEPASQPNNPPPEKRDEVGYVDPCAHGDGCNGGSTVDGSRVDPTKSGSLTDPNPVTNGTMPWNQ